MSPKLRAHVTQTPNFKSNIYYFSQLHAMAETSGEWSGEYDPLTDPEEKRVLFAALDSFR